MPFGIIERADATVNLTRANFHIQQQASALDALNDAMTGPQSPTSNNVAILGAAAAHGAKAADLLGKVTSSPNFASNNSPEFTTSVSEALDQATTGVAHIQALGAGAPVLGPDGAPISDAMAVLEHIGNHVAASSMLLRVGSQYIAPTAPDDPSLPDAQEQIDAIHATVAPVDGITHFAQAVVPTPPPPAPGGGDGPAPTPPAGGDKGGAAPTDGGGEAPAGDNPPAGPTPDATADGGAKPAASANGAPGAPTPGAGAAS